MATIVQYTKDKQNYVLVGAGFGVWATSTPSAFWGSMSPNQQSGTMGMVAVADAKGVVSWVRSDEIKVLLVDGKPPERILASATGPYR